MKAPPINLPILEFTAPQEFEDWLAMEPASSAGAWLKFAKKAAARTISKEDAIDCALCHGWIDGQLRAFDDTCWLIRFTPRRAGSKWSEKNRSRATQLIADGRIKPQGLAEIARARADGRWDAAYPSQGKAIVPADLQDALEGDAEARAQFSKLDRQNRYAVIYRVHTAKTPERRRAIIAKLVAMLACGETIHPRKQKPLLRRA